MQDLLVRRGLIAAFPLAAFLALAGCAASETAQPNASLSNMFATPEWAKGNQARAASRRAVTQDDLLNPDGSCAMVQTTDGVAQAVDADAALDGQGALPAVQGGVALGMTECQVLQRTGAPDTLNIAGEGTDRETTLMVGHGAWPGQYRFRGGRLVTIDRVNVPEPVKPSRPSKQKKVSTNSQPAPLRGAQR